jgi:prepilin-type processing-associated H-X9-DG protein
MAKRSRVVLFEQIRRERRLEPDVSVRELARRFGTHRRTVREALKSAVPPPRRPVVRPSPVLDVWKPTIDAWLEADREAPRKQRHTARRVWQRLVDELHAQVGESTVRRYVAEVRRRQPAVLVEVKVPQWHPPGAEAEVDFGQMGFWLDGVITEGWMFVFRLSASGKGFHRVYLNRAQQAFLDGHVRAFEHMGGVPGRIRYDNLKPAVQRVQRGRDRAETERLIALRSHDGFDSFFCQPRADGADEKGGVEGEVGRFRRRHLVPVPRVASLAELNALVAAGDLADDGRRIDGRAITVGDSSKCCSPIAASPSTPSAAASPPALTPASSTPTSSSSKPAGPSMTERRQWCRSGRWPATTGRCRRSPTTTSYSRPPDDH